MPLQPGATLAHYEIVSALGAGGMGEVYRARDPHLDREVAVKVLPADFADDAERLARFEREAKLLASLNHPNVAAIHGFEASNGTRFLVLELVEGEDLQERLARGPIPLDETIEIARQIALALAEAHAKGIVHRDLKPANVKRTPDGQVKVLDFGLAKAWAGDPGGDTSVDLTHSPTLTHHATLAGVILGTAAYMSPEQARGRPVDQRADLWAFGVVLWEVLTGNLLFEGETVSDVMAAVLTRDPEESALPASTPPALRRLLRRCLARDPRRRLHSAADAVLELDEAAAEISRPAETDAAAAGGRPRRPLAWLASAVVASLLSLAAGWLLRGSGQEEASGPAARFAFARASELGDVRTVTFSPRGDVIAYDLAGGSQPLYVRELDAFEPRALPGTEDSNKPFFSPDGRWLGFYADGKLRKVSLSGGNPTDICDAARNSPGAAWGPGGRILFTPTWTGNGLWLVDAEGGEPVQVSRPRPEEGESSHFWPDFLPGGRFVLFTVFGGRGLGDSSIAVLDLETGEHVKLFRGARPRYVASGHLVFFRDGVYLAVPFDPRRRRTTGEPVSLGLPIRHLNPVGESEQYLALADDGALVYVPGDSTMAAPLSRLAWLDRVGREEPLPFESYHTEEFETSPDGTRVAVVRYIGGEQQIWLYDLERGVPEPLVTESPSFDPHWRPDGRAFTFTTQRRGNFDLWTVAADASSPAESLIATSADEGGLRWAADGASAILEVYSENGRDLWSLVDGETRSLLATPADDTALGFSPEGQWLGYRTAEAVYVARWPELDRRVLIAPNVDSDGGVAWSKNGAELFYALEGRMMAVPYTLVGGELRPGAARELFELPTNMVGSNFQVAPDGRFLVRLRVEEPPDELIRVVLDGSSWLPGATDR